MVWGEDSVNLLMRSLGGLQFPVSRRIHSSLGCDNIKMLISIEELRRNPFQVSLCICDTYQSIKAIV